MSSCTQTLSLPQCVLCIVSLQHTLCTVWGMCHTVYQVVDSSNREYSEDSSVPLTPSNILSSRTNNDSGNHEDNTHLELKFTGNYTGTSRWTCERASTEYTTPSTCTPAQDKTELAYEAYYDRWNSRTYYSTLTISCAMNGNDLVCTLNLKEYTSKAFSNPISHLDISAVGAESKSLDLCKAVISNYSRESNNSYNFYFTISYSPCTSSTTSVTLQDTRDSSYSTTFTCTSSGCSPTSATFYCYDYSYNYNTRQYEYTKQSKFQASCEPYNGVIKCTLYLTRDIYNNYRTLITATAYGVSRNFTIYY